MRQILISINFSVLISLFIPITKVYSQTWQEYNQLMFENFQAGNNPKAIEYGKKAIELLEKTDTVIRADYGSVLNNLSYIYLSEKQYDKAEKGFDEVLQIITPVLGIEHPIYLRTVCYLAEIYMHTGRFNDSEKLLKQVLQLRKKILAESDVLYIYTYTLLKDLYLIAQKYETALLYQDTIIDLTVKADGIFHENHLIELSTKAAIYEKAAQFDKAIEIMKVVINEQDKKDKLSERSFNFYYYLARLYKTTGNYPEAIKTFQLIAQHIKKKYSENNDYANALSSLGVTYFEMGNYKKAEQTYHEAFNILKKLGEDGTAKYALLINNMAVLYSSMGDLFKAEQYYLKAKEIRKATLGEKHPDYAQTLNGLATLYQESGNYNKAEALYNEAVQIFEKQDFKSEAYYTVLVNLGSLYDRTNNLNKSADIYLKAYKTGIVLFGEMNDNIGRLLRKIAELYKSGGHFSIADTFYTQSFSVLKKTLGQDHPEYANLLNSRGELYLKTKEFNKAEKDLLEAASITKKIFGEFNYQYSVIQNNLAALYFETGQTKKCEYNIVRANENIINKVNESLSYMTGQESEVFLNSVDYLFDIYYSYYFIEKKRNPALTGFAFDNILAQKGLMLQAEKNLRKSVLQTGDSILIKNYIEFISIKEKLARFYTSVTEVNDDEIKTLNKKAEDLEKKLATNSAIFNARLQMNNVSWKEVKKNLLKDEVAIEFIRFQYHNLFFTDSIFYCALILRPDYKYPKMIYLFEEKELASILKKENYHTDEEFIAYLHHKNSRKEMGFLPDNDIISTKLDSLIWRPLEPFLNDIKTVFYSPAGLLHNISFVALSINDSTYVSDKYKLHTLLSTRNVIGQQRFIASNDFKVSLYGGIDYDVKPEIISKLTRSYKKDTTLAINKHNLKQITQSVKRGGSWSYLHGTLEETEAIEALFKEKKIEVENYKGDSAIEETFKQYSGNIISPNIIHIATHGFFFPDPEKTSLSEKEKKEYNIFQLSKNPLFRSGLLFAGANRSWNNEKMPENAEDGILTAYEVSNTNLINTELVVLSACETGLGEIKGGEGVYGLQRSFKIAGAEYIIMSLWQIPDYQTVELMKLFYTYRNLGFTIPDAFNQAQKEMKQKYLPYYWAAFVLIK